MKHVVLDIETNGLIETVNKMHCLVIRDVDTDEVISCADQPGYTSFASGIEVLKNAERIYGHNIIKYDRPVLHKLTGYLIPWPTVFDTLVVAGLRWTNLKETDSDLVRKGKLPSTLMGKNTLEAWGYRLGNRKIEYGEKKPFVGKKTPEAQAEYAAAQMAKFAVWTKEMQEYCEQDTAVTADLVRHIRKHGVSALAVETEQELCAYLYAQECNGWPFHLDKAIELQATLAARRQELEDELRKIFGWWFKPVTKHGVVEVFTPKVNNKARGITKDRQYTKIVRVDFNPGSRQHIAERLQKLYGWKPTSFTPSGQPEVNEDTLLSLPQDIPGVKALVEYLLVTKRLGQLAEGDNAWLRLAKVNHITGMNHIHHAVLQSGTITHRAAHIKPNLAQVPKVGKPYGEECRGLFGVPEGWVQVGADASGLELRELSHYMARFDGGAYGRTVLEGRNEDGTDIHSVNRNALGLSGKLGRDQAKTFIYAFLYGSGDLNLGQLLGCTPEEMAEFKLDKRGWKRAHETLVKREQPTDDYTVACLMKGGVLRARFLKNLPAVNALIAEVKAKAKAQGYLTLHDGRRVPVRYQHAALNSLLQGSGSIVCKRWIVRFSRRLTTEFGPQGWNGQWAALGWIHDEVQLAVRPAIAERVKEILIEEIRAVTAEFNLRIALDGEAKTGRNWADCH